MADDKNVNVRNRTPLNWGQFRTGRRKCD